MLISWKITAYVYLVKAGRLILEKDIPEEYRVVVSERLIGG